MGKKVILLLFLMFAFTFVGAVELTPTQIGDDYEIYQECNNCTGCNFTRVTYGGELLFSNIEATQDGTHYSFLIEGGNLTEKDTLTYCYSCGNSVEKDTGCNTVPVTYNGHTLTPQTAILYLGLIIFLIFIMGLLFMFLNVLPTDARDDQGFVLEVSKLAYIRPVVKGSVWILLTSIVFIASNIAIAYLDTGLLGSFLFGIFTIMMLSNLIIIPLCIIAMIQRIVLSKEMLGLIERGVEFK